LFLLFFYTEAYVCGMFEDMSIFYRSHNNSIGTLTNNAVQHLSWHISFFSTPGGI